MNRRTVLKVLAGGVVSGGAGVSILANAFKPEIPPLSKPRKIEFKAADPYWNYHKLDPEATANLAYKFYDEGSCMYAVVQGFISQLSEQFGEPYASFPVHMMKYGHGGIGGFGTVCGALNGASSLIGLFVSDKGTRDVVIKDLFQWYEKTPLPILKPEKASMDFTPPPSVCGSTLCHASTTCWSQATGYRVKSKERAERCRRISGDVAAKLAVIMNQLTDNTYVTESLDDETTHTCISCHDKEGKLGNTSSQMNCTTCHTKSVGHKLFGDIHYKLMDKRE